MPALSPFQQLPEPLIPTEPRWMRSRSGRRPPRRRMRCVAPLNGEGAIRATVKTSVRLGIVARSIKSGDNQDLANPLEPLTDIDERRHHRIARPHNAGDP